MLVMVLMPTRLSELGTDIRKLISMTLLTEETEISSLCHTVLSGVFQTIDIVSHTAY